MKYKKALLCLAAIVIVCFLAFSFTSNNDELSIPENAKILEYDDNGDNPGELVRYHYSWEEREKVDEDKDYYYYKSTDSKQDYNVVGYVGLKLDTEHVNGSSADLKVINSEFKKILEHEYNDTRFGNLNDRDSASEYDGINYAENLNYSAFDGENAYITIHDENGKLLINKKLDEFFFACQGNDVDNLYILGFDSAGGDMMLIYNELDDKCKVELSMIFNSDNGAYVLKIPLKAKHEDDINIDRDY